MYELIFLKKIRIKIKFRINKMYKNQNHICTNKKE